jgi:hypothetical protein
MSKKVWYILAFLILAFMAAFVAWKYTFKKSETSMASRKTDITIEAALLLQAFETNEDSANARFLDKIVVVTGIVKSVTQDSLGYSVYLKDSDAGSGVMCSFDNAAFDPALVKSGSKASIKGLCTGYLMDVVLNKCSIANKPGY